VTCANLALSLAYVCAAFAVACVSLRLYALYLQRKINCMPCSEKHRPANLICFCPKQIRLERRYQGLRPLQILSWCASILCWLLVIAVALASPSYPTLKAIALATVPVLVMFAVALLANRYGHQTS
jgi:hypothetical protein